jgi:hypothetical protein
MYRCASCPERSYRPPWRTPPPGRSRGSAASKVSQSALRTPLSPCVHCTSGSFASNCHKSSLMAGSFTYHSWLPGKKTSCRYLWIFSCSLPLGGFSWLEFTEIRGKYLVGSFLEVTGEDVELVLTALGTGQCRNRDFPGDFVRILCGSGRGARVPGISALQAPRGR